MQPTLTFSIALSSIASASSFLSLAFSASSALSRLASDTSRPPIMGSDHLPYQFARNSGDRPKTALRPHFMPTAAASCQMCAWTSTQSWSNWQPQKTAALARPTKNRSKPRTESGPPQLASPKLSSMSNRMRGTQ